MRAGHRDCGSAYEPHDPTRQREVSPPASAVRPLPETRSAGGGYLFRLPRLVPGLHDEDAEVNYFSFHIGDYAVHTRYLSLMEDLAYRRLLDLYYTLEGPIPDSSVEREIGMAEFPDEVCDVLRKFFVLTDGQWHNARCDEEIAAYKAMSEGGKRGAAKRWAKGGDSPPITPPMPTSNHEPVTKKERETRATRLPAPFVLEGEWREWAKAHRPDLDPDLTAAKFADYWHAKPTKDGRKLDWFATWRNWVREERPPKTSPFDVARVTVPGPAPSSFLAEQAAHMAQVKIEREARKKAA